MTAEPRHIEEIPLNTLLERVQGMLADGFRLVRICCTRLPEDHEVNYSFDGGPAAPGAFRTLSVRLPLRNPSLQSISGFYWSAFLYENEMQDLFGVEVKGMVVDYNGRFYKTAVPHPYAGKENGDAR